VRPPEGRLRASVSVLDVLGKETQHDEVSKSVFRAAIALSVLLTLACQARADQITTFNIVNGQLQDGASVTGWVQIDTSTGNATAVNVSIGSPDNQVFDNSNLVGFYTAPANTPLNTNPFTTDIIIQKDTVEPLLPVLALVILQTSLVGYTGGPLVLGGQLGPTFSGYEYGYDGPPDFTPEIPFSSGQLVASPEPATITMLASGLFAAGGFGLLRRRRTLEPRSRKTAGF
jgi:hypothetical protein